MERYGYRRDQIRMRFYVGKFAGATSGTDERTVREWCANRIIGGGPIEPVGLADVIDSVRRVAASKTNINNPVIVSMKVLAFAKLLDLHRAPQLTEAAADAIAEGPESGLFPIDTA